MKLLRIVSEYLFKFVTEELSLTLRRISERTSLKVNAETEGATPTHRTETNNTARSLFKGFIFVLTKSYDDVTAIRIA